MEIIVIVGIVLVAAVAIATNAIRKADAPAAKPDAKQPRGANGRFVKKGSK